MLGVNKGVEGGQFRVELISLTPNLNVSGTSFGIQVSDKLINQGSWKLLLLPIVLCKFNFTELL